MPKVVLVLPKSGYRNEDFLAAAGLLGVEVIAASDVCHQLAGIWEEDARRLRFRDAEAAAEELAARKCENGARLPVLGVDDLTALVAALAAEKLGLPPQPSRGGRGGAEQGPEPRKLRARPAYRSHGSSWCRPSLAGAELEGLLERAPYPCVVKPLVLSGSRGVIRADNRTSSARRLARVGRPAPLSRRGATARSGSPARAGRGVRFLARRSRWRGSS